LTANLQLRPCHNRHAARLVIRGRPAAAFGSRSPKRPREGCITVLAEPRSTAPPRCTSRGTVFSTARRACDLTSDVLCRDLLRIRITLLRERPHPHRFGSPGPPPPSSRQRRRLSSDQDAFHRRVLPPPVAHRAFAWSRGITRSPPPVSLLACSWLSPPRPGFRRRFTLCARTLSRVSQGARPMAFRPGPSAARRLLQPTQPASTTAGPSEPRLPCNERSPRALARAARSAPRRCFRAAVGPDLRGEAEASLDDHSPRTKHGWRRLAGSRQALRLAENLCRTRPRPHPTA